MSLPCIAIVGSSGMACASQGRLVRIQRMTASLRLFVLRESLRSVLAVVFPDSSAIRYSLQNLQSLRNTQHPLGTRLGVQPCGAEETRPLEAFDTQPRGLCAVRPSPRRFRWQSIRCMASSVASYWARVCRALCSLIGSPHGSSPRFLGCTSSLECDCCEDKLNHLRPPNLPSIQMIYSLPCCTPGGQC